MITKQEYEETTEATLELFKKAGIVLTPEEERKEVADFGLADLKRTALQLLVYIETKRVCAKELVLYQDRLAPSACTHRLKANRARKNNSAVEGAKFISM